MSENQSAEPAPVPATSLKPTSAKKRGRPSGTKSTAKPESKADHPQHRIDQLKAELEKAQAELEKAQEALRDYEGKRDMIVGRVVVAHAFENPDYRKQLAALLHKQITGKGELSLLGQLLG